MIMPTKRRTKPTNSASSGRACRACTAATRAPASAARALQSFKSLSAASWEQIHQSNKHPLYCTLRSGQEPSLSFFKASTTASHKPLLAASLPELGPWLRSINRMQTRSKARGSLQEDRSFIATARIMLENTPSADAPSNDSRPSAVAISVHWCIPTDAAWEPQSTLKLLLLENDSMTPSAPLATNAKASVLKRTQAPTQPPVSCITVTAYFSYSPCVENSSLRRKAPWSASSSPNLAKALATDGKAAAKVSTVELRPVAVISNATGRGASTE
mmetsp:Transcript_61781/g.191387  ORF Transcript_61781/g.191387 Transcript_61781/m.191387 type:complete len:273 (+) Transcript_61781:629-1447(+)